MRAYLLKLVGLLVFCASSVKSETSINKFSTNTQSHFNQTAGTNVKIDELIKRVKQLEDQNRGLEYKLSSLQVQNDVTKKEIASIKTHSFNQDGLLADNKVLLELFRSVERDNQVILRDLISSENKMNIKLSLMELRLNDQENYLKFVLQCDRENKEEIERLSKKLDFFKSKLVEVSNKDNLNIFKNKKNNSSSQSLKLIRNLQAQNANVEATMNQTKKVEQLRKTALKLNDKYKTLKLNVNDKFALIRKNATKSAKVFEKFEKSSAKIKNSIESFENKTMKKLQNFDDQYAKKAQRLLLKEEGFARKIEKVNQKFLNYDVRMEEMASGFGEDLAEVEWETQKEIMKNLIEIKRIEYENKDQGARISNMRSEDAKLLNKFQDVKHRQRDMTEAFKNVMKDHEEIKWEIEALQHENNKTEKMIENIKVKNTLQNEKLRFFRYTEFNLICF